MDAITKQLNRPGSSYEDVFLEAERVISNLEHRITALEGKQAKDDTPRDGYGKQLTPRRSFLLLKSNNNIHALFLNSAKEGYYKLRSITLHDGKIKWLPQEAYKCTYNMPAHIAEAIIAAAEKEDC